MKIHATCSLFRKNLQNEERLFRSALLLAKKINTLTMIGNQHPWHDVSPGEHLPQIVTAVIEIPAAAIQNTKSTNDQD